MHFRTILLTACLFLAALMQAGCDSTPEKEKYRVGIINPSSGLNEVVKGFKLGMAERGYKEGENLTYIECGPIKLNEVAAAAKKMIKQDIDLLYTTTTHGTKTAKETLAGTDIPIVFAPMFSPEKSGVVSSLLKPDGNITGVKVGGSSANTFFWLMSILPNTKHIFIPFHCTDPAASMCFVDVSLAARKAGVTIEGIDITNQKELEAALDRIPSKTDAIWLSCSPLIFSNIGKIVSAA
ncbi:MAG: hypothetical protein OEL66_08550, partial [Desulfobulbaceae bacterium]|nr:hypothetical protein [Desulfobulbaceae bacterium]